MALTKAAEFFCGENLTEKCGSAALMRYSLKGLGGVVAGVEAVEEDVLVGGDGEGGLLEVENRVLYGQKVEAEEVEARAGQMERVRGLLDEDPRRQIHRRETYGSGVGRDLVVVGGVEELGRLLLGLEDAAVGGGGGGGGAAVDEEVVLRDECGCGGGGGRRQQGGQEGQEDCHGGFWQGGGG